MRLINRVTTTNKVVNNMTRQSFGNLQQPDNYDDNPNAARLLRFSTNPDINVSEIKHKQLNARHQAAETAKVLSSARKKAVAKHKQLDDARKRKGG